ncbi:DUF559 domain-containing protein [Frankia sp. Cppng1_Ct_nod]|uniref:endonuclease domain-containing protein n=1 Tax=Frankia sp. Cppng1_Ct_nod TaxID=2897162 RepID=UPI0010413042|nr:DUF559 domain-containing protein [Frankia sp. Cppng1_Ct_nod]
MAVGIHFGAKAITVGGEAVTWSWAQLPLDRVVRLTEAGTEAIALSLEPLPDDAPAVVRYRPVAMTPATSMIKNVLDALDTVATALFPAWLPDAELLDGPAGAGTAAARVLARRAAATAPDFGPFLADLAERSLAGGKPSTAKFVDEVRAVGLTRVVATSFHRTRTAILVQVPDGLTPAEERSLVTAFEWLTYHGRAGVWLTGAALHTVDRVCSATVRLTGTAAEITDQRTFTDSDPAELPSISYPALAGRPHPASQAEQILETALAAQPWAMGRAWNQTYRFGPLVNPVRLDLLWSAERCVVEVDGPEHRAIPRYEADRRRDVDLQLDGFAVLRFTNTQIIHDLDAVLLRIERFIRTRRQG